MFKERNISSVIVILLFILASCAGKPSYRFNNVTYESPESALSAQRDACDQLLSKITPTGTPAGGVAVFISPSLYYIKENFIVYNDLSMSDDKKNQMSTYPTKSLFDGYRCDYEVIEKRRIFDSVIYTNSDNPESATFNENYAILLFKKDNKGQYFIKRKNNAAEIIPVGGISTAIPPVQRLIIWLDNIEKAVRGK